jgi:hypothetical protein
MSARILHQRIEVFSWGAQGTDWGPTYGNARVILDGRIIKLGASLNF